MTTKTTATDSRPLTEAPSGALAHRRCAVDHGGSHLLDSMASTRRYYECRGCRQAYSRDTVVRAGFRYPSTAPGVEAD